METKSQKNIINVLYFFLVASTILSFVPTPAGQVISLFLVIFTLIAAYIYRSRDHEDGLLYNHMTYMIGTIWIGTSFIFLGMIAAGIVIYAKGDRTVIEEAVNQLRGGVMFDEASLKALMNEYASANRNLLVLASLPTIGPAVLYFVYRVANGFGRACKGYRIANPKSWL